MICEVLNCKPGKVRQVVEVFREISMVLKGLIGTTPKLIHHWSADAASREVAAAKHIVNDPALVDGVVGKVDVAFAEVRSGNDSTPSACDGQI